MKKIVLLLVLIALFLCGSAYGEETQKNVALGKEVIANTGDTPLGLTDGDNTSAVNPNAWRVQQKYSKGAEAIISLGQEYVVSKIIVYNGYPTDIQSKAVDFSVYYASLDKPNDFKLIGTINNVTAADNQTAFTLTKPVGAAYVKFQSNASSESVMRIREIEVYEMNSSEKKVYALYHGYRRTREYDGDLGAWKQFTLTPNSTKTDHINYNADVVDAMGNHSVAAANGEPVVGMQSDSDPDYIEYEILLAKMSGINGFMIDFAFPEHGNTTLLNNFLKQAEKYNFEIGVDYTDSSLMEKDWISYYRDDIVSREDRLNYLKESIQYLIDNVYSKEVAAKINDHPLMYVFGGGLTNEEMSNVMSKAYSYPGDMGSIYYIRRMPLEGSYSFEENNVKWKDSIAMARQWKSIGVDVYPWIVPRLRNGEDSSKYDYYANENDIGSYLEEYSKLWGIGENVTSGFVFPGMDNYPCGGWGENPLFYIDRCNGQAYINEWKYQVENRNNIDVMLIGSWSDFTEGHEIAPTKNNGYREIETTMSYANQFRGKTVDSDLYSYIQLPEKLFNIRKSLKKYEKMGVGIIKLKEIANMTATLISNGEYEKANEQISKIQGIVDFYDNAICHEQINVDSQSSFASFVGEDRGENEYNAKGGIAINFNSETAKKLNDNYFTGKINLSYYGDNTTLSPSDILTVKNRTLRPAPEKIGTVQGDYGITAQITRENSNKWEAVSVELYNDNCSFADLSSSQSDISIKGLGLVRDVSLSFDVESFDKLQSNDFISAFGAENSSEIKLISNCPDENFTVYVALYESNGDLSKVMKYENSEILTGVEIGDNAGGEIKFFVWDNNFVPLEKKLTMTF